MKITVENTDEIIEVDDGVQARVWVGATEAGIAVQALIVTVSPQTTDPLALAVFERELQERPEPSPFAALRAALNPLRNSLVEDERSVHVDLGPCCMCETSQGVTNIIMLDRRCAVPGHGWGCVVCHLPNDGAVAVLCDDCHELYRRRPEYLLDACRGHPATEGRIAIEDLPPGPFAHDLTKHAADGGDG
jgi:hypothetical protein